MGYPEAEEYKGENLLFEQCDILIPAAVERVIHKGNADNIKAKVCYFYMVHYAISNIFISLINLSYLSLYMDPGWADNYAMYTI